MPFRKEQTIMKAVVIILAVLFSSCLRVPGQLALESGQSWTYTFLTGDELLFRSELPFAGFQTYTLTLEIQPGSFQEGSQLRCEIVRGGSYAWGTGSPEITPMATTVVSNVPPHMVSLACTCPAWMQPDAPGGVRLTMLSGAVTIDTMTLEARVPYAGSPRHDTLSSMTFTPAPGPRLSLHLLNATQTRLTWSTNAVGYRLESAMGLPATGWVWVTNMPSVIGGQYTVDVERIATPQYFRLRRP